MTVCLINVGHLDVEDGGQRKRDSERAEGEIRKFLADREGLFQAPSYSPLCEFHVGMRSRGKAVPTL